MKDTSTKKGDSGETKALCKTLKARDALLPQPQVNTNRSRLRWESFAKGSGFPSLREMLFYYYVTLGYTTRELGALIGTSKDRATQLLKMEGIPVRKRGGIRA